MGEDQIILSPGLHDQDDNIDFLVGLFEKLQLATVETADPHLDLFTFVQSTYYFAVILERPPPPPPPKESTEDKDQGSTSGEEIQPSTSADAARLTRNQRRNLRRNERKREDQQRSKLENEDTVCIPPFFIVCCLWT
jgi:hypothetical protein